MTRDENFIPLLERYLDEREGSTPLPEGVRDAVRAQLRSTVQRHATWWPAWHFPATSNFATFAISAATLLVIVAVGIGLFATARAPEVGGPIRPPDASSRSSDPTSPSPGREVVAVWTRGTDPPITVTVGVPEGWANPGHAVTTGSGSAHAGISFWTIRAVFVDPCNWEGSEVIEVAADGAASSVVSAFLTAWAPDSGGAAATAPSVTEPREAMLDGYPGQYLELTAPSDIAFPACDGGGYRLWVARDDAARFLQAPGRVQRLWFLEVDTQVLVVDVTYTPVAIDDPDDWSSVLGQLEGLIATLDIQSAEE